MKQFFLISIAIILANVSFSQESISIAKAPQYLLKTNVLYWATTTPNLGFEAGLNSKLSLDLSVNFNPWNFDRGKTFKHFLVQPELRYWTKERFNGHFFGVHLHYASYNMGGFDLFGVQLFHFPNVRYDGNLYGAGLSYGYQWKVSNNWNFEATVGLGYAHLDYNVYYTRQEGQPGRGFHPRDYFTPTKVGFNLVYVIK
jgi:hypothetical protein